MRPENVVLVRGTKHASPPPFFTICLTESSIGSALVHTAPCSTVNVKTVPSSLKIRSAAANAVCKAKTNANAAKFNLFIKPPVETPNIPKSFFFQAKTHQKHVSFDFEG